MPAPPAEARGGGPWELVLYLSGLAVVVLALLSPLDTFAAWLFTLHMVEHQLLTMVASPLLLLANPFQWSSWRYREGLGMPLVVS